MKLLMESDDNCLKGDIAIYFSNYIYGNLRGDCSEVKYNELEKYYNLLI